MTNKYLYFLDSDSDLEQLLVSISSLQATEPGHVIEVLLHPNVSSIVEQFLKTIGVNTLQVSDTALSFERTFSDYYLLDTFEMFDYTSIVYIDYKSIITANIDELFTECSGSHYYDAINDKSLGYLIIIRPCFATSILGKEIKEHPDKYSSVIQAMDMAYRYSERTEVKLPYQYSFCLTAIDSLIGNSLFNLSKVKTIFIDIPLSEYNIEYKHTLSVSQQNILNKYLKEYNLIISTYKRLYPEWEDALMLIDCDF